MKFFSTAAVLFAACSSLASAHFKGFNIAAERPDGTCKSPRDWDQSFRVMKRLPGGFNAVRLYASSDCGTLQNAVPAAIKHKLKVLVGVWSQDNNHYAAEKAALKNAIRRHGVHWMSGISVGSEDLYRGDNSPGRLAQQIGEVRRLVRKHKGGKKIPVGHVDTWTAWVNPANVAVIKASNFIGMDAYPYFQGAKIGNSKKVFYDALAATKRQVAKYHPRAPIWVTETGWPVAGPNFQASVASKKNARYFWKQTMCSIFRTHATYAYTLRDYQAAPANPSFGVVGKNFRPLFNLHC